MSAGAEASPAPRLELTLVLAGEDAATSALAVPAELAQALKDNPTDGLELLSEALMVAVGYVTEHALELEPDDAPATVGPPADG